MTELLNLCVGSVKRFTFSVRSEVLDGLNREFVGKKGFIYFCIPCYKPCTNPWKTVLQCISFERVIHLNNKNREINSSLRAVWYILARQNGPRAVLAGENIPHARKDEFIGILVTLARVAR